MSAPTLSAGGRQMRRARADDLARVVALQQVAYAPNRALLGVEPLPLQADYVQIFATMEVWCLEVEDRLAAVLILQPSIDHLLIWSIATDPTRQSDGLGKTLLAASEARAAALGLPLLRLYTGTRMTHLVSWYGRHGYTVERVEQLPDRSVTHMSKPLRQAQ
jgi:ribosomal protein S18 acetylase RimI-like enzyme